MRPLRRIALLLTVGILAAGLSWAAGLSPLGSPGGAEPVPIPGGFVPFEGAPFIHVFVPGPRELNFMGFHVEPNVITHFRGFAAMAYLVGTASDREGNEFDLQSDIRVYQGDYMAADGSRHHGTFGFI